MCTTRLLLKRGKRIGERVTGYGKMKNGNKRKIVKERSHRVRVLRRFVFILLNTDRMYLNLLHLMQDT